MPSMENDGSPINRVCMCVFRERGGTVFGGEGENSLCILEEES